MKRRGARINRMRDFAGFLESWRDPAHPDNAATVNLQVTEFGNINCTGEPGNYDGHALSKWQAQFRDSLENGIRELVLFCVDELGWITYTSCEGHAYPGQRIPCAERHVGFAPRSEEEAAATATLLRKCAEAVNRSATFWAVRVEVVPGALDSDGAVHPIIDLFFRRRRLVPWRLYFRRIDDLYSHFLAELRRRR